MERKSIGSFIATLRKANGLTQREFAEYLNVSDKTVSRWERDEGAPELSLIPVIAELFQVTCDELLRGERKSPDEREQERTSEKTSQKADKMRKYLLKSSYAKYQNKSYIAMGIAVAGLFVALICNFAFTSAVLGFFLGAIFFAASIFGQVIFMNQAMASVEDAEIDEEALFVFKSKCRRMMKIVLGVTIGLFGFVFPCCMVEAYLGLTAIGLFTYGSLCAILFTIVYIILLHVLEGYRLKHTTEFISENDKEVLNMRHKRKTSFGIHMGIVLACTMLFHAFGSEVLWSEGMLVNFMGVQFQDYESFVNYMEKEDSYFGESSGYVQIIEMEDGTIIQESEVFYPKVELKNKKGDVLCTYVERNEQVARIEYGSNEETLLPIVVYTTNAYAQAYTWSEMVTSLFFVVYVVELVAGVWGYRRRYQNV